MDINIYKYAAQVGLGFPTRAQGLITTEQLFQLPLLTTRANGTDLEYVAKTINNNLKAITEESFVSTPNPNRRPLEIALEIVKDVIKTKQDENAAVLAKRTRAEKRTKLLDALEAKEGQQLAAASVDDLRAQLAALDE